MWSTQQHTLPFAWFESHHHIQHLPRVGFSNGSIGKVKDIIYSPGTKPVDQHPPRRPSAVDLPYCVWVEVDDYVGPSFFPEGSGRDKWVPIYQKAHTEIHKVRGDWKRGWADANAIADSPGMDDPQVAGSNHAVQDCPSSWRQGDGVWIDIFGSFKSDKDWRYIGIAWGLTMDLITTKLSNLSLVRKRKGWR